MNKQKTSQMKDWTAHSSEWGLHGEFHDLDMPVCSARDCTGLIPALPQDEEEILAYEELYPYLPRAANSAGDDDAEV